MEYAWEKFQIDIDEDQGWAFHKAYHEMYPQLAPWHKHQRKLARRHGYVRSPLGRIRHLPHVQSEHQGTRIEAELQAINSPVQTTASDFMLMSAVRLENELNPSDARNVGLIHDAGLYEVREDKVDEVVPIIKAVMEDMDYIDKEFGFRLACPLIAETDVSTHWGVEYE